MLMNGFLQRVEPRRLGDRWRRGRQPARVPVAAEGVEFRGVRLHESLRALGEVIAVVHIDVDDSAVAQRYRTPRSVREFRRETDDTIRRRLDHEIGKAIQRRRRVVLQLSLIHI